LSPTEKPGGEIRYTGRVSTSCSTSGICRVNPDTNPVINTLLHTSIKLIRLLNEKQKISVRTIKNISQNNKKYQSEQ
jgi:hypothetical protein